MVILHQGVFIKAGAIIWWNTVQLNSDTNKVSLSGLRSIVLIPYFAEYMYKPLSLSDFDDTRCVHS